MPIIESIQQALDKFFNKSGTVKTKTKREKLEEKYGKYFIGMKEDELNVV